ncbi:MAG TPA: hypothetical protein VFZ58_04635 [Candidatus Saccharimonadales bacterium]
MPNENERPSPSEQLKPPRDRRNFGEHILESFISSTNPEEHEAIETAPIVTFLTDLKTLTFTKANGETIYPLQELGRDANTIYNHLHDIYAGLGPGTHSILEAIKHASGRDGHIKASLDALEAHLPSRLFQKEASHITFGRLELQARNATEAEITEFDKGKPNLTTLDHALIRVGESYYFLPLQFEASIVAARAVQALANIPARLRPISLDDISTTAWHFMPITERRAVLSKPENATDTHRAIKPAILSVLKHLTNTLLLTREPSGERFKLLNSVTISYSEEPMSPQLIQELDPRPVGPSIHKNIIHQLMGERLPETILHQARRSLQIIAEQTIPHEQAVRTFNFIMSPLGKRAIREVFEPTADITTPTSARLHIERVIEASLGESFKDAQKQRRIGGNRGAESIMQISEPASASRIKWYIGPSPKQQQKKI